MLHYIGARFSHATAGFPHPSLFCLPRLVETGGVLNRVVHFWEYDDLDHRSAVRAQLAGDEGFVDYFGQIRPWLRQQSSVLVRPLEFSEAAGEGPGFFALTSSSVPSGADTGAAVQVGAWREVVGTPNGTHWTLLRANSYQELLDAPAVTAGGQDATLMAPLPFSPMQ